jgi:hypothetical protein
MHGIIAEGIATYFGGTMGRSYRELLPEYSAYLLAHPHVTLDTVLAGDAPDRGSSPSGAVLVDLVHRNGGISALQQLLRSGRSADELRATLAQLLGASWEDVGTMWKAHLMRHNRPEPRSS